jgi:hypothetical protein
MTLDRVEAGRSFHLVRLTAPELAAAVRAVRCALGTDPDLPMLTGVLLGVDDGAARVAATDRYRLTGPPPAAADVGRPPDRRRRRAAPRPAERCVAPDGAG